MNWATYNSKKSKVCEFKKIEEVVSQAKEEIKNDDDEIVQSKTDEIKRSYIALVI